MSESAASTRAAEMTTTRTEPHVAGAGSAYRARISAELRSFFRQRESVVFTLVFPVVLLVLFGLILGGRSEVTPGVSFTQYFVAGMIAAGVLASSFQNLAIMIPIERDTGLLKRLRGTPMPKSAYFIGKVVQVIVVCVVEIVLLLVVGMLLFDVSLPATPTKWLVFIGVVLLGTASCTLLGIAFSSVPKSGRGAPAMVTPIALILQFISGVFFVFTLLPAWLQIVASLFPLKWMTQGMRYVFLPDSAKAAEAAGEWELGTIFLVLGAWTVVGLALCALTFRWRSRTDG
ncbi:ABC transporter permease [Epidermidibacterium keratini]|nr:ABC transporter permease [Epidermidibacterium keratini]